ncbi:MAG: hypothetical protein AAF658_11455, partial [Myxococcota bacterium]
MTASARLFALSFVFAVGCGGARSGSGGQNAEENPGSVTSQECTTASECASGVCEGGFCAAASSCTDDVDCLSGTYCAYPSNPVPWVSGTEGQCALPCTGDSQCDFGQACIDGVCYTNIDCDPANANEDCPPGEVCSLSGNTCSAPPSTCFTDTQCPVGWRCNVDNTCVDPTAVGAGGCSEADDCVGVAGCAGGDCECVDNVCRPVGSCTADEDCAASDFCNGGECQAAQPCSAQVECTPYGLVCEDGLCKSPEPCNNGTCSQTNFECNTAFSPPACFPNSQTCQQPSDCPSGSFCDIFSGTCQQGCNNNAECAGECGGLSPCNCNSQGQCVNQALGTPGADCLNDSECGGGQVCAPSSG